MSLFKSKNTENPHVNNSDSKPFITPIAQQVAQKKKDNENGIEAVQAKPSFLSPSPFIKPQATLQQKANSSDGNASTQAQQERNNESSEVAETSNEDVQLMEQLVVQTKIDYGSEPAKESSSSYWTHDWHTDRFGNEALFIWEVGGKRTYSNGDKGYTYIRKKALLSKGDTGYDSRFERYRHRPQQSEGSDPKLNWWIKRTPGWDNQDHVDNGTADFNDLAEFKDSPSNKKGTGFYYMAYVFDPLIYEKLAKKKQQKENNKYIGNQTNYRAYINAESGIILHDTPSPFDDAYQTKRSDEDKADFIIESNQPVTVVAEGNADNEGWVLVKNSNGEEGWIERRYISKEPKPKSEIFDTYIVQKGDNLEGLIKSYYKNYPNATGNDQRTVALAIYLYNKDKSGSGVYRNYDKYKNAGSWKDTIDPWMQETRANYQSIELYTGGEVVLPPAEYIKKMHQLGKLEKRPDFVNVMIESGRMLQGFVAGVGIGFWNAILETGEDLYNTIVDIFTGEIFKQIADMFKLFMDKGLSGVWKMIEEFGVSTWEEVKAAWNNPNPYQRGKYFGKIIGMILFEVVLALLTWGIGSVVKNSARAQKILKWFPNLKKKSIVPDNVDNYADDIKRMNRDKDVDLKKDKTPDADLKGPQKGTGTDSEIDDLAKKDKNQKIEDDIKDGEPDAGAKRAAMKQAKAIVTAGDVAGIHPTKIMSALWALTVFKGVRGFSFAPLNATDFEIYMHGSKKRIKPKDGTYDVKKGINKEYSVSGKRRKHILDGDPPGTGHGPNRGQTEGVFPDTWTDDQAIEAIERIASGNNSTWKQVSGPGSRDSKITLGGFDPDAPIKTNKNTPIRYMVQGFDHGVKIEVIVAPNGEGIITGYVKK